MKQNLFIPADILLPKERDAASMHRWSVVACDQYTSDPAYWNAVEQTVGGAPSTLRMILPELYLGSTDKETRINDICRTMETYEGEVLETIPSSFVYIERTMKNGTIRHGLIGAVDLEAYDYNRGSQTPIRATEGTVLSRIPPRVQIRKNATLEAPHVMLLIDDPENRMISLTAERAKKNAPCYDFDLMQNGGHLTGWLLSGADAACVDDAVVMLSDPAAFRAKYDDHHSPLVFAVGDGNHSLATAKACYELVKETIGAEAALRHPARYALAELVNLHDEALVFEPIYRVLFGVEKEPLLDAMKAFYPPRCGGDNLCEGDNFCEGDDLCEREQENAHRFTVVTKDGESTVSVKNPTAQLPVGTLQAFLDAYLADHPEAECDYIHGEDAVRQLTEAEHTVGFLFEGMSKDGLFRTVVYDGALPRKTFSMGEADEKRYYLECRKIR
ncbi:MAG: DUF1015 domain-containing protein [Clostridia bacterium]|nr:DUF1015 domain-containing protein [Clostridia bacterium]